MQCLIPIYICSIIIGDGCVISSSIMCGVQCECFVPSVDPITHTADVIIHCASVGVLCIYQLHGKWVVHVKLSRSNEVVLKAMALCYCSNSRALIAGFMGPHGAYLGPAGPRWALCGREPCYLGAPGIGVHWYSC